MVLDLFVAFIAILIIAGLFSVCALALLPILNKLILGK